MRVQEIWLWSANGELVHRVEVRFRPMGIPFVTWDGLRYEPMPRQHPTARVLHYRTRAIIFRPLPRW